MLTREEGDVHICQKRNDQNGRAEGQENTPCKNLGTQEEKGKEPQLLTLTCFNFRVR